MFLRSHKLWQPFRYLKQTFTFSMGFPGVSDCKECACDAGDMDFWFLGQEDSLEKEMATHSSILARRIPWTEEPGGL